MAKSSQISTTNQQTPNNTSTSKATTPKTMKSIPYTLACRTHTIITDKNLKKTRFKELNTTLNQSGYPKTLINKGFELAENITTKRIKEPKKHKNEKPLTYIATDNKNNPELFTEIIKNLEELLNNDKIKEILDTTKSLKARDNPKIIKEHSPLLHLEKTQHKELPNAIINEVKYVI